MIATSEPRNPIAEGLLLTRALLRNRALAIRRDWKSRSLYGFAVAAALGVFAMISLGTYAGVHILTQAGARGLIESIPAWAFLVYLFTDILIAFGQALGDLYLSRDMPILVAMPLRTANILIAKFVLGVAQNEVYVAIFLLPFALAYLAGMGAPWWAYPEAVFCVALFPALLYAPLIIVTIAVLRIVPAKIAKEGLWLLGASVPTVFWFLSFYRVAHMTGDVASMRLPQAPEWLPSTWIGNALALLAQGQHEAAWSWIVFIVLVTFLACPTALIVVARSFHGGWTGASTVRHAKPVRLAARAPSTPVRALVRKDLLAFARSPQLWFNHITALVFVVFLLVGHKVQTPLLPLTPQLAMVQAGFVAVFGALNPGMTALSLEHFAVWVIRAAPLSARQIVWAKLAGACGQAGLIAGLSGLALGIGYRFSAAGCIAIAAFALGASCSAICTGLAFDARHPSFAWENPNHINRGVRMVVPFLTNVATLSGCAVLLFGARRFVHPHTVALGIGLGACALLQFWVALGAVRSARRDVALLEV